MGIFDDGIAFDHERGQAVYYYLSENRFADLLSLMEEENETLDHLSYKQPKSNTPKEDFEEAVTRAKEYVASGDIFQVVLSKRYDFNIKGNLVDFYQSLRMINPSPYMYFLKMGDRKIIGSSPEMLARVDNRIVETFPIAGTRPCTKNP
ncbi:MAG TPA: chorismate-binding protein, partial [Candidatus Bathyarchaeia archaeon]